MQAKPLNPLLLIGLIGFFVIGSVFIADVLKAFYGDRDIYWTHESMKLPIEKTNNDFQVFISGKLLQKHLSDNTLLSVDANGIQYPVVSRDVFVRLNNWCEFRSRTLIKSIFTGVAFGVFLTLLIVGIVQTVGAGGAAGALRSR